MKSPTGSHLFSFLLVVALGLFPLVGCKSKKKGKTIPSKGETKKEGAKSTSGKTPATTDSGKTSDKGTSPDTTHKGTSVTTDTGPKGNSTPDSGSKTPPATKKPAKNISPLEKLKAEIDEKFALAKSYLKKRGDENQKNAILAARDVLKLNYEHFGAMLVIAEAQYNLGSFGKMLAALERIKLLRNKMSPPTKTTARWHILMGRFYLHLTRDYEKKGFVLKALFQKGKATTEFSHPTTDNSAEALFVRGSLFLESGEYQKALKALTKAEAQNDPEVKMNWRLYLNLGVTYIYNKSYLMAEKKLSYCLRALNANCMTCHFNLALIFSLWDEVPSLGSYTTAQRANLAIKHAGQYRAWLKSQRSYDKTLLEKVNRWIEIANSKK